jgi:two-component system, sensor histidine kinase
VADEETARAALAAIADRPVLVFCDLWLSDERSGIVLLQTLATLARGPFCGILISGDTRPETIQAARAEGFPLLHKPVAPAKLRAAVAYASARRSGVSNPEPGNEDPDR